MICPSGVWSENCQKRRTMTRSIHKQHQKKLLTNNLNLNQLHWRLHSFIRTNRLLSLTMVKAKWSRSIWLPKIQNQYWLVSFYWLSVYLVLAAFSIAYHAFVFSETSVTFTYSVSWLVSDIPYERRFDAYLDFNFFEHQVCLLEMHSLFVVHEWRMDAFCFFPQNHRFTGFRSSIRLWWYCFYVDLLHSF